MIKKFNFVHLLRKTNKSDIFLFAEINSNILLHSHSNTEKAQCILDSIPSGSKSALKANEKILKVR